MIAIVDFGSQYTQLIAKRFRRLGFQAQVFPSKTTVQALHQEFPNGKLQGIVLSGSPSSVGTGVDPDASLLEMNLPILAICFGYQFIARHFGGKVEASTHREYGQGWVDRVPGVEAGPFLSGISERFRVWMSHGDSVVAVPEGAEVFLRSEGKIAAFWMPKKQIWALQFHPEVYHSQFGEEIFLNFAQKICGVRAGEWSVSQALEKTLARLRHELRDVPELYCAVSGGTDSTVLAVLLSQVTRVKAIMVDHGFLRAYDLPDLKKFFAPYPNIDLEVIDAREVFWKELRGVTDPEKKRKTIGRLFIETFYSHIGVQAGQKA
ncbi:MAG: gamma-glutamyl-gamma-aminobutyrate hydrolase family protein, partial [Bdellovibrionales bacterium]|nr:gamma-glutamyl-gamma-aminobutyrate hydrolase family protein [Bdellovibrionales bacterium]